MVLTTKTMWTVPYSRELEEDARAINRAAIVAANGGYMAPRLVEYWMRRGNNRAATFLLWKVVQRLEAEVV